MSRGKPTDLDIRFREIIDIFRNIISQLIGEVDSESYQILSPLLEALDDGDEIDMLRSDFMRKWSGRTRSDLNIRFRTIELIYHQLFVKESNLNVIHRAIARVSGDLPEKEKENKEKLDGILFGCRESWLTGLLSCFVELFIENSSSDAILRITAYLSLRQDRKETLDSALLILRELATLRSALGLELEPSNAWELAERNGLLIRVQGDLDRDERIRCSYYYLLADGSMESTFSSWGEMIESHNADCPQHTILRPSKDAIYLRLVTLDRKTMKLRRYSIATLDNYYRYFNHYHS